MAKVILFLLVFLVPSAQAAKDRKIKMVAAAGDTFFVESCDETEKCERIGRESGYRRAELDFWVNNYQRGTGSFLENSPLMLGALGAVGVVASVAFGLPLLVPMGIGVVTMAIFGYSFSQHPQVQAKMPNDVYAEFQARPEMVKQLKAYLTELDAGVPGKVGPRVIGGAFTPKVELTEPSSTSPPEAQSIPAN